MQALFYGKTRQPTALLTPTTPDLNSPKIQDSKKSAPPKKRLTSPYSWNKLERTTPNHRSAMNPPFELQRLKNSTRRHFFKDCSVGLAGIYMGLESGQLGWAGHSGGRDEVPQDMSVRNPHFSPKTKNVIYIHLAGSPPFSIFTITNPNWSNARARIVPTSFSQAKRSPSPKAFLNFSEPHGSFNNMGKTVSGCRTP